MSSDDVTSDGDVSFGDDVTSGDDVTFGDDSQKPSRTNYIFLNFLKESETS
jgi:hypothetical protein